MNHLRHTVDTLLFWLGVALLNVAGVWVDGHVVITPGRLARLAVVVYLLGILVGLLTFGIVRFLTPVPSCEPWQRL